MIIEKLCPLSRICEYLCKYTSVLNKLFPTVSLEKAVCFLPIKFIRFAKKKACYKYPNFKRATLSNTRLTKIFIAFVIPTFANVNPSLSLAHLHFSVCQLFPQKDLIIQIGELTLGRSTKTIIKVVKGVAQSKPQQPIGTRQPRGSWTNHRPPS